MSYKVLSLHTRSKIVQFCHEALQQRHFSLNINLCHCLAPTSLEAEASPFPAHLQLSQETTKPAELTSAFPQPEIWVQTTRSLSTPPSKVTQNRVSWNYEVSGRSANKHLARNSGGKGSKSSDTSSSCSRRNYWVLIFRNAMLTRWMAELNHLQIQQAEKQHQHAIECPKHPDSTQYINYIKN